MHCAPTKNQRFLDLIQIVLAFVSVCAVVDASHAAAAADRGPGFHVSVPQGRQATDRRFSDLARFERKRREAEQERSRRRFELAGSASTVLR